VERIWRREGLKVPRRQKPRGRLWFNDGSCVRLPESPMAWSKCPKCEEPFSECQDGPLPGQKTYIHSNGDRHIYPLGAATPSNSSADPQIDPAKPAPFSGASGRSR
jgi:hypothetical protein